jgi:two-component system, NtrC family, response regulator PilR
MPGTLNGVDALRAIRAERPDLPVIMVTANADEDLAKATLRAGAFDYVMKPVNLSRLRELLTAAMALTGKEPPA